jgi:restriction system protein
MRDRAWQAVAYARAVERLELERLRDQALTQSLDVEEMVDALGRILSDRDRGLERWRERTDAASAGGAEEYARCVVEVLSQLGHLNRAKVPPQAAYAPESRQITLVIDLPSRKVVPTDRAFRYAPSRRDIVSDPRRPAEIQQIYQNTIAQLTLCVADYVLGITSPDLVDAIAINGHVRTKDRSTGQPVNPCLVSFLATRAQFEHLILDEPELDPVQCLQHLKALVSPHPFDLEPVTPIVDFQLQRVKLVDDESGPFGGPESRVDLLKISPYEFERLIKDLFSAMGYKAWSTQHSRDDGVDAVAVRDDTVVAGHCVIQAKRYRNIVPVEAVRALRGTMDAKKAATGVVVTTSWFGAASYTFAQESGRITLIEGRHLKDLLLRYLAMDVLISARPSRPTAPP